MALAKRFVLPLLGLVAGAGLVACGVGAAPEGSPAGSVVVYRSPTCGCCASWEAHLREHGYEVTSRPTADLPTVKAELGVPPDLASCHTAVVDGYVVEGHVPAGAIDRLLAEAPDAHGIFVPGMPVGSPGMELPSGERDPYDVILVDGRGARSTWLSVP